MRRPREHFRINAGSMADIAFLMLIFFLVATTIPQDKGLTLKLPPVSKEPEPAEIASRNLFKILINSEGEIWAEQLIVKDVQNLKLRIKEFVMNPRGSKKLAESPKRAVISLKPHRGCDYATYILVLDLLKQAYYEIYAERAGLSPGQYRRLNLNIPRQREQYEKARKGIPMNISIAESDLAVPYTD